MSLFRNARTILFRSGILLWGLPLAFLIGFFFFPMVSILWVMFTRPGEILINEIWQPLGFTIYQATLSTLLTLILGLPAAFIFSRFDFTGKKIMHMLTMLPFILPTVVAAAAFNALLGPRGWINLLLMKLSGSNIPPVTFLNTFTAILVAHVFYNIAIIIRVVGSAWTQLDPRLEQSARVLGASPWRAFREVTLPLLKRSLLSAALLVFLFDFASFGVILMLGGPANQTLEVAVYTQALYYLNLPMAALLSIIQLSCTLGVMLVYGWVNRGQQIPLFPRIKGEGSRRARNPLEKWIIIVAVGFLFLLQVLPLISLAARSVTRLDANRGQRGEIQTGFTFDYYQEIFTNKNQSVFYVPPIKAIRNSLEFAGITVLISVTTGTLLAYALVKSRTARRWIDPLVMLPFGASAVTLGLGFIVAFNKTTLGQSSFPWLIPIAHSLVAMPFVLRAVQPAIDSIPASLRHAAVVLGASPFQVWWQVELKLIGRALISSALFAFTISLGEFGATSFIARPENSTLPVAIFRYLSQPGAMNYGQAMAMATLLVLVCALSLTILENLSHALIKSS